MGRKFKVSERNCEICGTLFTVNSNVQKVCSKECRRNFQEQSKMKVCPICNKQFIAKDYRRIICYNNHYDNCSICGKQIEVSNRWVKNEKTECKECRRQRTNLDKYGSVSPWGNKDSYKKAKLTMKERYGSEHSMHCEELKDKYQKTMLERYGVTNPFDSPELRSKIRETMKKKYGEEHNWKREDVKVKSHMSRSPNYISKINIKFHDRLLEEGIITEYEHKINTYWYDLVVKGEKIVIEINPTITHNSFFSIYNKKSKGRFPNYHLNKTKMATRFGYLCLHVWDWDNWDNIVDLIKNINNCQITQLDSPRKCWSKGSEMFYDTDDCDEVSLIKDGWLPVYDSGQLIKE